MTEWGGGGTARYVKLQIAILNFPPIVVCCRHLSLTNLVATTDGRNYPSCLSANFQHVKNFVTAKQFIVIPFRFRWQPHPSFLWHFHDVRGRLLSFWGRHNFIGRWCQRLLTTKQRQVTSNLKPWRHIVASNEIVTTLVRQWLANFVRRVTDVDGVPVLQHCNGGLRWVTIL